MLQLTDKYGDDTFVDAQDVATVFDSAIIVRTPECCIMHGSVITIRSTGESYFVKERASEVAQMMAADV